MVYGRDGSSQTRTLSFVTVASTLGSVIEWYDLFVYGALVVVLSQVFFPSPTPALSLLAALAAFVAGAAVRPFGGAVFGRLGDLVGRKFAFLLSIIVMGVGATFTGLLPTYASVGLVAPALLLIVRVLQGLALGGEYGGAAIYIAEHAPDRSRGYWTGYVQATATCGLILSLAVVLATRVSLGQDDFLLWGWRVPFLVSSVLVVMAILLRWRLKETPIFTKLKGAKKTSDAPLRESMTDKTNLRRVLLALVLVSGSSVIWHTAQFYSMIFMQTVLELDFLASGLIMLPALLLGAPFFVLFGWLSDKVGRKKVLLLANLAGAIALIPLYVGMKTFSSPPNIPLLVALVFLQVLLSAMAYGPLAAFLVELFPARIRYTSLSVAHGVGTGDIGDGTVLIAPALVLATGNIYAGLIWSVAVPLITLSVGLRYMRETREIKIWEEPGK
ncbi:MAG: MFS transporter [Thaumarchaeota archaeon]|nr:MFS transporter [Nitrososphaerota archaeon]